LPPPRKPTSKSCQGIDFRRPPLSVVVTVHVASPPSTPRTAGNRRSPRSVVGFEPPVFTTETQRHRGGKKEETTNLPAEALAKAGNTNGEEDKNWVHESSRIDTNAGCRLIAASQDASRLRLRREASLISSADGVGTGFGARSTVERRRPRLHLLSRRGRRRSASITTTAPRRTEETTENTKGEEDKKWVHESSRIRHECWLSADRRQPGCVPAGRPADSCLRLFPAVHPSPSSWRSWRLGGGKRLSAFSGQLSAGGRSPLASPSHPRYPRNPRFNSPFVSIRVIRGFPSPAWCRGVYPSGSFSSLCLCVSVVIFISSSSLLRRCGFRSR